MAPSWESRKEDSEAEDDPRITAAAKTLETFALRYRPWSLRDEAVRLNLADSALRSVFRDWTRLRNPVGAAIAMFKRRFQGAARREAQVSFIGSAGELDRCHSTGLDAAREAERRVMIWQLMKDLDEESRKLLSCYAEGSYSWAEIGELFGMSADAARVKCMRLIAKLRKENAEAGGEERG